MLTRPLVLVFAGGLLVPPIAESASTTPPAHVAARLYNTAQVDEIVKDAALRVATGVLLAGGIDLRWKNCDVADACVLAPERGELVVRLVRTPSQTAERTNQIVPATLSGRRNDTPLVLGEAFIDTRARTGTLATVFINHVELIAAMSEIDAAVLLGRSVAHEIGHLLLGTTAHSVRGLMRAQWTVADVRRHASGDWALTTEDAAAIRRRLR